MPDYNYVVVDSSVGEADADCNPMLLLWANPSIPGQMLSVDFTAQTLNAVGVLHPNTTISGGATLSSTSFSDIFYDHIHIFDRAHDFGDVTSAKIQYAEVWSAYSSSKVLNPINQTAADGISLSSLGNYTTSGFSAGSPQTPPTVPTTYLPGESRKYSITANVNGPSTISGSYQFVFASAESPYLTFTGTRVTLLMGEANWRSPVVEKIGYLTDITSPVSGNEQRRGLLRSPRRKYDYVVTPRNAREGAVIRSVIWGSQVRKVLAPEWPEQTYITAAVSPGASVVQVATQNRDFINGGVCVIYSTFESFEILQIDTVSSTQITLESPTLGTWKAGTKIIPARYARMAQVLPEARYLSTASEFSMSVEIDPINSPDFDGGYSYPYSYRGYNVFMERNNDVDLLTNNFGRNTTIMDNRTGIFQYTQWATYPYVACQYSFLKGSRALITAHRNFIHDCRGRLKPFWMPTWQNDFEILAISGTSITIKDAGFSRYVVSNDAMKDIAFIKPDGTASFRRISSSINNMDGTETLTIDSSLSASPTDFRIVCALRFCRLDADEVEFQWVRDDIATCHLPIRILAAA